MAAWNWIWSRLFLRLQIFVGVIGVLCVVLAVSLWSAEQAEQSLDGKVEATMKKQSLVEKANGLVYAVVMESRGLYMAKDAKAIERFGKGLERHLETLKATAVEWQGLVDESDRADFEAFAKNNAAFITLRTQLVAEARAKGSEGARAVGDNEANRSVRTAFNKSLETLAETYRARLAYLEAENEAKHFWAALFNRSILMTIVVMVVIGWLWLGRYMARPFRDISNALARLNAGETAFDIPNRARIDEVGVISRAIETFRSGLSEREAMRAAEAREAAGKSARQQRIEAAIGGFEASAAGRVESVAGTSGELHTAAATMSTAAEETSRQAEIVAEAANELTANIDGLAVAGNQLAGAIGEIADGMRRANDITERASQTSSATAERFAELEEAVGTIGKVVELINSIASQTNLLALNATIEAARAGEAGRGFAVVAAEVKQLASQTTKATAEIAASVSHVQSVANSSVEAVHEIGGTIEAMRRIAQEVAATVEQQRLAAEEIAANVRNAARGTEQVSSNILGVSKAAADTGGAAMTVLQSAGHLTEDAGAIRRDVEGFLAEIRAA